MGSQRGIGLEIGEREGAQRIAQLSLLVAGRRSPAIRRAACTGAPTSVNIVSRDDAPAAVLAAHRRAARAKGVLHDDGRARSCRESPRCVD